MYGSPYLGAATTASAAGLVSLPQLSAASHAAAIAAATNQFYEYHAAPYPGQYAGFEYPFTSSAAAVAGIYNIIKLTAKVYKRKFFV